MYVRMYVYWLYCNVVGLQFYVRKYFNIVLLVLFCALRPVLIASLR